MVIPDQHAGAFNACVAYLINHPTLFFVGSGLSVGYPSVLPSAWDILHEITLPITIPENTPDSEIEAVSNALPELYHEALMEFAGAEVASLWQVLCFGQTEPELAKYKLGPNSAHMVLVYLAWRWRLPILTTNFDTMLESAAQMLGLTPLICYNPAAHHFREAFQDNEVAIWKLHGSVADTKSIHTTLYTITQLHGDLFAKLSQLFEKHRACRFPSPAFWVDPIFGPEHRIHHIHATPGTPEKFVPVHADGATLTRSILAFLKNDDPPQRTLQALTKELERIRGSELEKRYHAVRDQYLQLGRSYAHRVLAPMLPADSPERWLVHGLALSSVGRNAATLPYLQLYVSHPRAQPSKMCRALIIQAYAYHVLSRYQDSEHSACQAADIARKHRLRDEYGHALAAIDSALLQKHLPRLGYHDRRNVTQLLAWKMLWRMVYDMFRIRSYVVSSLDSQSTSAQIRARWAYLGHVARTLSFAESIISVLFSRAPILVELSKRLFLRWWGYFQRVSERDGYAVGIASARRYVERLRPGHSQQVSATSLYSLISGYTEEALIAFDRGNHLLQTGDGVLAREQFKKALDYAQLDGNLAVMLKAYIGLKRSGAVLDLDKVESTLRGIQGEAFRNLEGDLIAWFREI